MLRSGTIEVNLGLLRQLLKMPEDVTLLKVRQTWEQERRGVFEILVESPSLALVTDGEVFPWLKCTMTMQFCTQDEIAHIKETSVENY